MVRGTNSSNLNVSKNEWVCNHSFRRSILCKSAFNKRTEKTQKKLKNILKPSQSYAKLVTKSNQLNENKCSTPIPRSTKQNSSTKSNNLNSIKTINNKKTNLTTNRSSGLIQIFKKLKKAKYLNDSNTSSSQINRADILNSKGIFNLSLISSRSEASSGKLIPRCKSDSSLNYFGLDENNKAKSTNIKNTRGKLKSTKPNESKSCGNNLINKRNNRFEKKQRISSIFNQSSLASSLKFIQNSKLIQTKNKYYMSSWTNKAISIKRLNKRQILSKRHSISDIREAKKKFILRKKILNLILHEDLNQLVLKYPFNVKILKNNSIEKQNKLQFLRSNSDSKLIINEEIFDEVESDQLSLNWNTSDTFKMPSNLKSLYIDSGKSKLGLKFER